MSDTYIGFDFVRDGVTELSIFVGKLPGRKQYALYAEQQGAYTPLAYFVNEEAAGIAIDLLKRLDQSPPEPCK